MATQGQPPPLFGSICEVFDNSRETLTDPTMMRINVIHLFGLGLERLIKSIRRKLIYFCGVN